MMLMSTRSVDKLYTHGFAPHSAMVWGKRADIHSEAFRELLAYLALEGNSERDERERCDDVEAMKTRRWSSPT